MSVLSFLANKTITMMSNLTGAFKHSHPSALAEGRRNPRVQDV